MKKPICDFCNKEINETPIRIVKPLIWFKYPQAHKLCLNKEERILKRKLTPLSGQIIN